MTLAVMNADQSSLSLSVWPRHGLRLRVHGCSMLSGALVVVKHLAGSKTLRHATVKRLET